MTKQEQDKQDRLRRQDRQDKKEKILSFSYPAREADLADEVDPAYPVSADISNANDKKLIELSEKRGAW